MEERPLICRSLNALESQLDPAMFFCAGRKQIVQRALSGLKGCSERGASFGHEPIPCPPAPAFSGHQLGVAEHLGVRRCSTNARRLLVKGASTRFCDRAVPRSPDGQPLASRKDALFTFDAETHRERRRRSRVAGA